MKRIFSLTISLTLALAMLLCCMSTALAEGETAAQTTMPPATVSGSVEGTVLAIAPNDIAINLTNGNTINLMMNYISETEATVGDKVKIEYSGDLINRPEAVTITVTEKVVVQTVTGKVFLHDKESIFVEIASQQVFGFVINKDTVVNGKADYVVAGDTVTVIYDGDLYNAPAAKQIEITEAVKNRTEKTQKETENTTNKSLDGVVSKVTGTSVTIRTSRNNYYTFKINNQTRVTGSYSLVTGARITVFYDGYAAKSPAAKSINVYAPPDPSPTSTPKPSNKTVSGTVQSFGGMYLALTNGVGFDCAYATYSGNSDGQVGDKARVSYYVGGDGTNYATYITFTAVAPDPTPEPKPVTRTTTGVVTSFGGMYLELDSGVGFDCTYASYSGDGDRVPGDEARVTYYVGDDGMNYATKIRFTTLYQAQPDPEPDWDSGGIEFDDSGDSGSVTFD